MDWTPEKLTRTYREPNQAKKGNYVEKKTQGENHRSWKFETPVIITTNISPRRNKPNLEFVPETLKSDHKQ